MTGSVFVHLMRNRDDSSIIVKCGAQMEHNHSLLVQWFSSVAQISFFGLSDGSQTIYVLIELQVKGESQKLLLSDTFVATQTFWVDELLVTRLALQWWEESYTQHIDRRHFDLT